MAREGLETAEGSGVPPVPAIRAELEAVLRSAGFRKSERQSRFLRFVCEATLNGEGPQINEFLIAQAVFDRGADYSPGEDSLVRRQAYSVRQKLQDYYSTEGLQDPVRIALPVGRYVPTFSYFTEPPPARSPEPVAEPGLAPPAESSRLPEPPEEQPVPRRIPARWLVLAGLVAAIFFALGWGLSQRSAPHAGMDPRLAEVWGNWLRYPQDTVVCFSNPMLAQVFDVAEPFSTDVLPHLIPFTQKQEQMLREQLNLPPGGYFYLFPQPGTNAKMGEALGSVRLAMFLTRSGIPVRATQSRLVSWEDFRSKNLILLGHMESNRWLDPILGKLPLRLAPWQPNKPTRVINSAPRSGEPAEYDAGNGLSSNRLQAYSLVSMVEGVDGRHELLLINGLSTEGTQIGEEFLTDPFNAVQLITALRTVAPRHTGPWRFQMLLRADVHENVPTRADLVTVRVL